jgi:hypothetical protein
MPNPKPEPEQPGIIHAGIKLAGQVSNSLAPQFLALLIVNALMFGGMLYYIGARAEHTMTIINQLLTACLGQR